MKTCCRHYVEKTKSEKRVQNNAFRRKKSSSGQAKQPLFMAGIAISDQSVTFFLHLNVGSLIFVDLK